MKNAIISQEARNQMIAARGTAGHRTLVRKLFAECKTHYRIPAGNKVRCELDNSTHPQYLQIIRKKTNQPYLVADHLVPTYTTVPTFKYTRIAKNEGAAMLRQAAADFGTLLKKVPAGTPQWMGSYMANGSLIVPVGSKTYSIPLADAMAVLAVYGDPVELTHAPDGEGGMLATDSHLLIPA